VVISHFKEMPAVDCLLQHCDLQKSFLNATVIELQTGVT
jgi:hypothetical protein